MSTDQYAARPQIDTVLAMAAHLNMQSQLRELYLMMDPHQLDSSQLDYEVMLRGLDLGKSERNKARTIQNKKKEESLGMTTLDHLYGSPLDVVPDTRECNRLCQRFDKVMKQRRVDSATLDRLWSQTIHLIARLDRMTTAHEPETKHKFEMLFWAETIREKIEYQKAPNAEFIPCVSIPAEYQRKPELIEMEDISESSGEEQEEIRRLSQRLENISPIGPVRGSIVSSTPSTSSAALISTNTFTISNAMNTQARTNGDTPFRRPKPTLNMHQWRDPNEHQSRRDRDMDDLPTPDCILKMAEQLRDDAMRRRDTVRSSLENGSLIDLTDSPGDTEATQRRPILVAPVLKTQVQNVNSASGKGAIPKQAKLATVNKPSPSPSVPIPANDVIEQRASSIPIMGTGKPMPQGHQGETNVPTCGKAPNHGGHTPYSKAVYDEIDRRRAERARNENRTTSFRDFPAGNGANGPGRRRVQNANIRHAENTPNAQMFEAAQLRTVITEVMRTMYPNNYTGSDRDRSQEPQRSTPETQPSYVGGRNDGIFRQQNRYQTAQLPLSEDTRSTQSLAQRAVNYTNNAPMRNSESGGPNLSIPQREDHGNIAHGTRSTSETSHFDTGDFQSGNELERHNNRSRRPDRQSSYGEASTNQLSRNGMPLITSVKPMQIGQWKLCFSGDTPPANRYDVDIHRFLGQIEGLCNTSNLSPEAVLTQILHLLVGSARDWFLLERHNIRTWEDFVRKLKENFLTSTHDNELYAKATRRKQGKTENVASYINQMRLIFDGMSEPLSEKFKLFLIKQNLHARYTAIVASHCPQTVADIMRIAREVENTRPYEAEPDTKQRPKYRGVSTVQRTVSGTDNESDQSSEGEAEKPHVAVVKSDKDAKRSDRKKSPKDEKVDGNVEVACFICGSQDHLQRQCKQKWPKHCYRCGMPDVVLRDCKNCNADTPKNGRANSATEHPDSHKTESP